MQLENLEGMKPMSEMTDDELMDLIKGTRSNRTKRAKKAVRKKPTGRKKKSVDVTTLSPQEQDALLQKLLEQKKSLAKQ
jgi:hypothetical protein